MIGGRRGGERGGRGGGRGGRSRPCTRTRAFCSRRGEAGGSRREGMSLYTLTPALSLLKKWDQGGCKIPLDGLAARCEDERTAEFYRVMPVHLWFSRSVMWRSLLTGEGGPPLQGQGILPWALLPARGTGGAAALADTCPPRLPTFEIHA